MTQEEKQLLLVDLCARLPYNVLIKTNDDKINVSFTWLELKKLVEGDKFICKPYLRSMSSMTNREKKDLDRTFYPCGEYDTNTYETFDWYNAHHFDYRGLIPKGLAIEAPEEMYK